METRREQYIIENHCCKLHRLMMLVAFFYSTHWTDQTDYYDLIVYENCGQLAPLMTVASINKRTRCISQLEIVNARPPELLGLLLYSKQLHCRIYSVHLCAINAWRKAIKTELCCLCWHEADMCMNCSEWRIYCAKTMVSQKFLECVKSLDFSI